MSKKKELSSPDILKSKQKQKKYDLCFGLLLIKWWSETIWMTA